MNCLRKFFSTRAISAVTSHASPVGILKRYEHFQQDFPHHLVLMQVGDFYEIYGEAVEGAAKILDIAVTRTPSKLDSKGGAVAMTGFPVRSFETFLSKLIRAGVSVVVADQVALADSARFDRKVSRVITPGTVVEENLLDRNSNNYLLYIDAPACNCAWMDISTGDFFTATCTNETELLSLLARLKPREVLTESIIIGPLEQFLKRTSTLIRQVEAAESLVDLESSDFTASELQIAAKLLAHVRLSMQSSFALKPLKRFAPARHFMSIDADSYRSLDIFTSSSSSSSTATLFATLNECKTALGSRLLSRRLQAPFLDPRDIECALDRVDTFFKLGRANLEALQRKLDEVGDIERILQRLCLRRPQAVSRDLRSLARSLLAASTAFESLGPLDLLGSLLEPALLELITKVPAAFNEKLPLRDSEGDLFKSGFDSELDNLRQLRDNSSAVFTELAASYRQIAGIPNLRVVTFKGDQQVVEVPKSAILPPDRKPLTLSCDTNNVLVFRPLMQTETRARYTTEELLTKSFLLRSISDRVIDRELHLLASLLDPILQRADEIRAAADRIAQVDLESTLALLAHKQTYTRPRLSSDASELIVVDGRHPVLDKLFTAFTDSNESLRHFTPNSLHFTSFSNFLLLTGPNMGGKSTFLRQNALIVLMAQCGSFVPATCLKFHPIDAIFTRVSRIHMIFYNLLFRLAPRMIFPGTSPRSCWK